MPEEFPRRLPWWIKREMERIGAEAGGEGSLPDLQRMRELLEEREPKEGASRHEINEHATTVAAMLYLIGRRALLSSEAEQLLREHHRKAEAVAKSEKLAHVKKAFELVFGGKQR